jgi:hypothetical protein
VERTGNFKHTDAELAADPDLGRDHASWGMAARYADRTLARAEASLTPDSSTFDRDRGPVSVFALRLHWKLQSLSHRKNVCLRDGVSHEINAHSSDTLLSGTRT